MKTLGIDSSTQGTKIVVFDSVNRQVVASSAVNYGTDLPNYNSPNGFIPCENNLVRCANPMMWIAGLELALKRLADSGFDMESIDAIGGDAQQHATIYLSEIGVEAVKKGSEVSPDWFTRAESPIWMDSSTLAEVALLDERFGASLRDRTGSPAIERFAAAQIMKFAKSQPGKYAATKRIHLLSSFLTSYLAGADAGIESGDGAGMNLLNLKTLDWDDEICGFCAPSLKTKLPGIVEGCKCYPLAERFAKYGLKAGIPVAPFTGDNPASLVGCGAAKPGCAVISLGTSDTFFAAMADFKTDPDGCGHVFGNPSGGFMSLTCFKNGSLARERVREELKVDWKFFDDTAWDEKGDESKTAFPYFEQEITPKHDATGIEANFDWNGATAAEKVRAVVRGQIANMYERSKWIGSFSKIYVTGGASKSKGIRSAIASIFGTEVVTLENTDSAAIGGAIIALEAVLKNS